MNILKAQSRTRRLIAEENAQGPGFSKFEVYGIHSLKFIDRVSSTTNSPAALSGMPAEAARELEVEVQAGSGATEVRCSIERGCYVDQKRCPSQIIITS